MNIQEVLRRDQRDIQSSLDALLELPETAERERCERIAVLREQLLHHGRAANALYGALLRQGAHPGAILIAIEAHAVTCQFLSEIERSQDGLHPDSTPLLASLVAEYFSEQEPVLALSRKLLSSAQERELAIWHERKRAAELGAGLGIS